MFGQEKFLVVTLPLLYWCIDINVGILIAIALLLSNSINPFLKFSFHTSQPYWLDIRVKTLAAESNFGFPSKHAQIASSLWGLLFTYSEKIWLKTIFITLILLIGISRIYLGVHFFHEVLADWLIGIITIIVLQCLKRRLSSLLNRLTLVWNEKMYQSSPEAGYYYTWRYFRYFLLGLRISALARVIFDKSRLNKDSNMIKY